VWSNEGSKSVPFDSPAFETNATAKGRTTRRKTIAKTLNCKAFSGRFLAIIILSSQINMKLRIVLDVGLPRSLNLVGCKYHGIQS